MPPDPKPEKRMVDKAAMRAFHMKMAGEPCEVCEKHVGTILHHVKYRSRGGDDIPENFLWVCVYCDSDHGALPSASRYG